MFRLAIASLLVGCAAESVDDLGEIDLGEIDQSISLTFAREHVVADIYHYTATVPVGTQANAALRIHRVVREVAPFVPRRTPHAAMLLHGDFATFVTNFAPTLGDPVSPAPGLAPYLAAQNIDVWGVDRRWTLPAPDGDISDLGTMTVAQELDDLRLALGLARVARLSDERLALVGFSHGGQLAYIYASVEAARPARQRHVDAIVPLDWYGGFGEDQADLRAATCDLAAWEYEQVAAGVTDSTNDFVITLGQLAASAPDDPSPFNPARTNRQVMLRFAGQTFVFGTLAPTYHLLAPIIGDDGRPSGLSATSEAATNAWFGGAPMHASMIEGGDLDSQLCGDGTTPIDAPLSRIRVPLFYIGAAGGTGDGGLAATTQVSSTDVTTLVVSVTGDALTDYGHGDLLYAGDAPARVWQPLASWLVHH
jgi:hypothetical protein